MIAGLTKRRGRSDQKGEEEENTSHGDDVVCGVYLGFRRN
jgi:hypothetical protein